MRKNRMQERFLGSGIEESQLRVLYVHFCEGSHPLHPFDSLSYLCLHSVTAQSTDIPPLVPPLLPI